METMKRRTFLKKAGTVGLALAMPVAVTAVGRPWSPRVLGAETNFFDAFEQLKRHVPMPYNGSRQGFERMLRIAFRRVPDFSGETHLDCVQLNNGYWVDLVVGYQTPEARWATYEELTRWYGRILGQSTALGAR